MKLIKRWRIEKPDLDKADVAWLTGCCNRLQVKGDDPQLYAFYSTGLFKITGPRQILVETDSEEQESMLKLKYEGSLTLMLVEHWDERDIQQRIDYYGEDWSRTDEC
jgi:hypothetical protein